MSQHNLSTVTLQTIANYRHAAELTVNAYRTGSHRLIDVVNQRLDRAAAGRTVKIAPKATQVLHDMRGRVTTVASQGIDMLSGRTDQAIAFSADGVAAQVTRLAELSSGVDNRYVADGLRAAARLSLPGAEVALALSAKVAEGADKLSAAVAGKRKLRVQTKAVVRKAVVARRAAVKATVKATKQVTKQVTKAVKATRRAAPAKVRAVVKAPVKRAARAAKAVAAEVSA